MTRFLPDTSCLVPAVCTWHVHHRLTTEDLARRLKQGEGMVMAAPVLVEAYAVLTRLPPPYRLRPRDALALMEGNWADVEVVATAASETWKLLGTLCASGTAGGASYDAVVAACARKAKVDVILTWNLRDFERVVPSGLTVTAPRGDR